MIIWDKCNDLFSMQKHGKKLTKLICKIIIYDFQQHQRSEIELVWTFLKIKNIKMVPGTVFLFCHCFNLKLCGFVASATLLYILVRWEHYEPYFSFNTSTLAISTVVLKYCSLKLRRRHGPEFYIYHIIQIEGYIWSFYQFHICYNAFL